ncbi:L,D-transpeptidase [Paenibacillus zanthoxyli]|uniref:L,D-transpeptidase n=1 Tax=Paenibacillus zanthoxyli TaxID=369399 RepID=UPI00046F571B|nr:L,D-transpeptidase [Paenibacillus zanthoxyli]
MSYHIMVNLKSNRRELGTLKMYNGSGSLVFGPVPALGRSEYDYAPTEIDGNTPTGEYTAQLASPRNDTAKNRRSYGMYGIVQMDPVSGQALTAKRNGRTGLWIHGGAPSDSGGLRPTHGCVRLSEDNQDGLVKAIKAAGGSGKVTISEN